MGVDLTGTLATVGTRYYIPTGDEKCLFVITCRSQYFVGASLLGTGGSIITIEENSLRREYKQSSGLGSNLTVGSYDVFSNSFTLGLEIGYRIWLKRPQISHTSGVFVEKDKQDLEKHGDNSFNFAVSIGWLF